MFNAFLTKSKTNYELFLPLKTVQINNFNL